MTRQERRRRAIAACTAFARTDPVTYDELADAGELRQHVIDAVDQAIDQEGAA